MTTKMFRTEDFAIAGGRLSWPQGLFEAKPNEKGTLMHSWTILIPKTDTVTENILRTKIGEAAIGQHGKEKAAQLIQDGVLKSPLLDGDGPQAVSKKTHERHQGYAGHWFIRCTATAKYPPRAVISRGGKWVPATLAEMYSGCNVNAVLNVFNWFNEKNGWGLTIGGSLVYFAGDNERLGGGGSADPDKFFKPVVPDEGLGLVATGDQGAASLFG